MGVRIVLNFFMREILYEYMERLEDSGDYVWRVLSYKGFIGKIGKGVVVESLLDWGSVVIVKRCFFNFLL